MRERKGKIMYDEMDRDTNIHIRADSKTHRDNVHALISITTLPFDGRNNNISTDM